MVAREAPQGDKGQGKIDDLLITEPTVLEHPQPQHLQQVVERAVDRGEEVGESVGNGHAVDDVGQEDHGLIELRRPQLAGQQHREGQFHRDHAQVDHKVDGVVFQALPQIRVLEHGNIVVQLDKVTGGGQAVPIRETHTDEVKSWHHHKAHQ